MSKKVSAMVLRAAMDGTEFLPLYFPAGTDKNPRISVNAFGRQKLLMSLIGNSVATLGDNGVYNDWTAQTTVSSTDSEWTPLNRSIKLPVKGVYEIKVTPHIEYIDGYGNPIGAPPDMQLGVRLDSVITAVSGMNASSHESSGEGAGTTPRVRTFSQWSDTFYAQTTGTTGFFVPYVYWNCAQPNFYSTMKLNIFMNVTVELLRATP